MRQIKTLLWSGGLVFQTAVFSETKSNNNCYKKKIEICIR